MRVKTEIDRHLAAGYTTIKTRRSEPESGSFDVTITNNVLVGQTKYEQALTIKLESRVVDNKSEIYVSSRSVDRDSDMTPFSRIQVGDVLVAVDGGTVSSPSAAEVSRQLEQVLASREVGNFTFRGKRHLEIERVPKLKGDIMDPQLMYDTVEALGGFEVVCTSKLWQKVRTSMNLMYSTSSGNQLRRGYETYFQQFL